MSIMIKIRETNKFTNNELAVAQYITKNYKNIKNMTQREIADKTFTSLATITRMCKKIGLSGFKEFKLELLEEISQLTKEISDINNDIEKKQNLSDIIESINQISIESLKENKLLQDVDVLNKVIEEIRKHDILDLYGMGASHLVCLDAQYKFMRLGKQVNAFSSKDKQVVLAKASNKKHLAIIVSYSGLTNEMIEIAKILANNHITVISITRFVENDLTKYCDLNLYVTSRERLKRSAAVYSRIAMLNLIDVIYFSYINKYYDDYKTNIVATNIEK